MGKYNLRVVTPCHIGSGVRLSNNIHFVVQNRKVYIIDAERVFQYIGKQGIESWCEAIENRVPFLDFIKEKGWNIEELCSEVIQISGVADGRISDFRPHISTVGSLFIPGSSIKGAIVSALVDQINQLGNNENLQIYTTYDRKKGEVVVLKRSDLLLKLFAKANRDKLDLRTSVLRYLKVGDVSFEGAASKAVIARNINIRESQGLEDSSKPAYLQTIVEGEHSTLKLTLDVEGIARANSEGLVGYTLSALDSEQALLSAVNNHTLRMLEREKDRWNSNLGGRNHIVKNNDDKVVVDSYLRQIESLIDIANECATNGSALLRLGYGSGWDFMTGGWIDGWNNRDAEDVKRVIAASRHTRKGFENAYDGYVFPKTRRVIDGITPMGFVIIENE